MRIKHENRNLWLQGLYIYHALVDVSPILHAFAKNGTSPIEYLKEPIALTKEEYIERKEREEKAKYEAMKASMIVWAKQHNQEIVQQKEVSDSGRGNN